MRMLIAAVLVMTAWPASAASMLPPKEITQAAIEGYIPPAFRQFAEEAGSLKLNVEALCATPVRTRR